MKKAFVTGGAGHVGGNLVRQLLNNGWRVRCLIHHDTLALDGLDVEHVQGDLADTASLAKYMSGCNRCLQPRAKCKYSSPHRYNWTL